MRSTYHRYAIDPLEPRLLLAADLIGTLFNVVPAQVGLNHTVTVNYTVKNQNLIPGVDYAPIFFVDFFLSANSSISASDIFLGVEFVPGLFAGFSHSGAVSLDLAGDDGSGPGTGLNFTDPYHNDNQYYIGMIINFGNQIIESDYNNNSNEGDGLDRAAISSEKQLPSPTDGASVVHTALTVGTAISGDIWHRNDGGGGEYIGPYDVDTFRFTAAANQTIAFDLDVEAFANASRLDSYMKLYNSSWVQLDQNDDGTAPGEIPGKDSYFGHTFTTAGTYYIVISDNNSATADPRVLAGRSAGGFGAYTLNTQITSPAPGGPVLRTSSDTGNSTTDGVTKDSTPTFDVTAAGAGTVRLYHNGSLLGQTTNASSSSYAVTVSPAIGDGQYDVFATYTASGAVESSLSATARHITIDTAAPFVTTPDLDPASNTGIDPTQRYTSDTTPTLVGSAEAAATAEVLLDGVSVAPVARNGATFTYTPPSALTEGVHSVTGRATDLAGNQATATAGAFTIDTIAPSRPALPDLYSTNDTGSSNSDNITRDTTPSFVGTVVVNHRVWLRIDSVLVTSTMTAADGTYALIPPTPLADGLHFVSIVSQDLAGNSSSPSSLLDVRIDTIRPTITSSGFRFETPTQAAFFQFSEGVNTPTPNSIDMTNLDTGQAVHPSESIANGGANLELLLGDGLGLFTDGNYRVRLDPAQFPDFAGNMLTTAFTFQFYALGGDANRDHHVNALDFNALAVNFGRTGGTFSQGNFNLDAGVNSLDFNLLAGQFNKTLLAPPAPLPNSPLPAAPLSRSLFATRPIDRKEGIDAIS